MDSQHNGTPPQTQTPELYYPLTCREWLQAVRCLKPAERDVLYYLRTMDPFGKGMDIGVREMAGLLGHSPGTVSKALKALDREGFIDLELVSVQVRVKPCGKLQPDSPTQEFYSDKECFLQETPFPTGNKVVLQETPESCRKHLNENSDLETAPSGSFKIDDVPIVLKRSVKKQKHPPTHPVPEKNEQERIGTLLQTISEAGIPLNKTIQKTVAIAVQQEGSAAAALRVQKSLSAVKEQQERGNCRNPGGMFMAAMRKGFTANELKGTKKQPPDLNTVALAIDRALMMDDRAFALLKLQDLWTEGWQEQLEQLCYLRKDWGFQVTADGLVERGDCS